MSRAKQTRPETPGEYLVPRVPVQAELLERGSRFLCELASAAGDEEARGVLSASVERSPTATHHCWAYRVGWPPRQRSSDAGEPAGTAGVPMLKVLEGRGLSDTMAVVTRWLGGTKLGRGGLARAYAGAVAQAVERAVLVSRVPTVELTLAIAYDRIGRVKSLLQMASIELVSADYGEQVQLDLKVPVAARDELEAALADLGVAATRRH